MVGYWIYKCCGGNRYSSAKLLVVISPAKLLSQILRKVIVAVLQSKQPYLANNISSNISSTGPRQRRSTTRRWSWKLKHEG